MAMLNKKEDVMSVVIVTGGTFGIGRAITLTLAERGHKIVAFGLEMPGIPGVAADTLASLRADLAVNGHDAEVLEADVTRAADVIRVVETTLKRFGRIDALVNNAAIGPLGTVLDTSEEAWDRIVAVNLRGPFLCAKAVLPHMIAQGGGSIVNIGSGAGWGKPNMAAYSASKGGLHALSSAMAYDFFRDNIRVNTVIPGGGGIVGALGLERVGGDIEKLRHNGPGTAAGRHAAPEDLAKAVAFLLSEDATTISGTVIDVGCFSQQGGPIPSQKSAAMSGVQKL
jgi:NAD(P)-dependent dehydrogenase (short-subunit alcohol dehydrogenase family)